MNVLDSRVTSSTPVVSVNFRKVQDLYNAIDDLRATMILEKKDLYLVATYMNKFSLVEGVIITFIALEAISYDPLKLVVDTLNSIAIHHSGDNRYKVPYELALEILADLPIPYQVVSNADTQELPQIEAQEAVGWDAGRIENTFEAINDCLEEIKALAKDYPADSQICWNLLAMGLDIASHLRTRRDEIQELPQIEDVILEDMTRAVLNVQAEAEAFCWLCDEQCTCLDFRTCLDCGATSPDICTCHFADENMGVE